MVSLTQMIAAATEAYQAGDTDTAESMFRDILAREAGSAEAFHGLALVARKRGDLDAAITHVREAIGAASRVPAYHNNLGVMLRERGDDRQASEAFMSVLAIDPLFRDAYVNLGLKISVSGGGGHEELVVPQVLGRGVDEYQLGRRQEAVGLYAQLLRLQPIVEGDPYFLRPIAAGVSDFVTAVTIMADASGAEGILPDLLNNLAVIFRRNGGLREATSLLELVVDSKPTDARARFNLALLYEARDGQRKDVIACLKEATRLDPEFVEARALLGQLHKNAVAGWHFPMMNDLPRNRVFDEALKRSIAGGELVLDIGSGSGLLAMMAARAGAGSVVACELVEDLTEMATQIVADNGLSDCIRVVNKSSDQLSVGSHGDLPTKADLVVAEIFDAGLFGEKAIATLEHARTHLLKEGGTIIPRGAQVYAMIAESDDLVSQLRVQGENACGFELGRFNELAAFNYSQINVATYDYTALTEPFSVLEVDFNQPVPQYDLQIEVQATRAGVAHAVIFWFRLFLDDDGIFDTAPDARPSHWRQAVQLLEPFATTSPECPMALRVTANQSAYRGVRFAHGVLGGDGDS